MSRTDDIINVAGHRLSTGGMEEVLASHPSVAECAVIGVADALKGQVPDRLRGAEGRRRGEAEIVAELVELRPRPHRPGRLLQERGGGRAPAEDALGQGAARDHAQDRRRRGLEAAGHDRRSRDLGEIEPALRRLGYAAG